MFSLSLLSELEQTSSAKSPVWCASVERCGRISYSVTSQPVRAGLQRGLRAGKAAADDFDLLHNTIVATPRNFYRSGCVDL